MLAIGFLHDAGGLHFLRPVADGGVEAFGGLIVSEVIRDGLPVFAFGLNDRLAFIGLLEGAFGALGFTREGGFLSFALSGKGGGSQREKGQARDGSAEEFFHS
jgi:hypothetical protein